MAQEPPWRRELQRHPGAVVRQDVPPIKSRRDLPGKHPVGRDQRGFHPVFGSLAQTQRDGQSLDPRRGRFDQGDVSRGTMQVFQFRPLTQPSMGDRRGPERERHQLVAGRRNRGHLAPRFNRAARNAEHVHQLAKAVLRMILGQQRLIQFIPNGGWHLKVETGQNDRPLRQAGHGLHQQRGGPARPGRASKDHRMFRWIALPPGDDPGDKLTPPRFCIGAGGGLA